VVERLWAFFDQPAVRTKLGDGAAVATPGDDVHKNGTGDGLMVACACRNYSVKHAEFLQLTTRLVEHMRSGRPKVELRIGVHQGPFSQLTPPGATAPQVVGTGINRCARLVSLGDAGDVTVSQEFIDWWIDKEGKSVGRVFSPRFSAKRDSSPVEVVIKHGETMKLRLYRPGKALSRPWPRKLEAFKVVEDQLHATLGWMEQGFVAGVGSFDRVLTGSALKTRVSIFATLGRADDEWLLPTQFRYLHGTRNDALRQVAVQPGSTRYSIARKGCGPVGRAFRADDVVVEAHLPVFSHDERRYCRQLKRHGLSRDVVVAFKRHARAFMAIPFGLMPNRAEGVICIDTMNPMTNVKKEDLRWVAQVLRDEFTITLGALWRLRGQI
jgi:hypothetical protein